MPPTPDRTNAAGFHESPDGHSWTVPLQEAWRLLVKRRWVVATCLAATVVLVMMYSLLSTPVYRAVAVIQIKPQGQNVLTSEDVTAVDPSYTASYQDFYQTQPMILRSRAVVELAVDRLDLPNRPEFANRKPRPIDRLLGTVRSWLRGPAGPPDPRAAAVKFVSDRLRVDPIRFTQLVELSVLDSSPELARDVVNAVAEAYIQFDFSSWHDTTNLAKEFLTKEVAHVQSEISRLERELQEYSEQQQMIALSGGSADISEQALGDLNAEYVRTLGRLAVAEANVRALRETPDDSLPEVVDSPLIHGLRQEYARIESRHGQLAERFKPGWPPLVQAGEELRRAGERLEIEIATIARQTREAARTEYERTRAELGNLERRLAEQKGEVQRVKQAAIELAGVQAEIETKRKVLHDLAARQSETDTSVRLTDTDKQNIRFIDRAELAKKFGPRLTRNLALSLIFGLFLGVAMAFGLEYLDNSIKTEADIQRVAGVSVLGYVPLFHPLRVVSGKDPAPDTPPLTPEMATHYDARSGFSEAFKNLRTSLLLACPDQPPKHVVVSSCEPSDGKSTVSVNLAIVLAQLGRKVLLVDADLRRPRLHRMLGLAMDAGLSSLLSGNATPDEVIQETEVPNLHAVACGPIPPNPTELVGSPLLVSFLNEATAEAGFDHVILDTAPLTVFSDPVTLASRADATVLVVRSGKTALNTLAHSMTRLGRAQANVVGAVLNAVTEQDQHYYYGHAYYYAGERGPARRGRRGAAGASRSRLKRRGGLG